jgi:alanyl-tRNA synthetase
MLSPPACGRSGQNGDAAQRRGFGFRHYFVIISSFVIFRIMTSAQIRQSFLDFFREKKHTIVPSSSLLPDAPNLLFTNAGMNQFVPIFLGQQKAPWNPPRVADTQKCIRAGGKHNDLEDVGLDTYHHTFFEMLGNWSFGDYFKKEAIEWAWQLVVNRWKFPAQRLYATVYKPGPNEPSEFDQEAHDQWARLFREADLDPAIHVLTGGKADNFWMMGDTGPCGPCSELHVDLTPDGDTRGALVNKEDPRCIEIWNLVFIQFNAQPVAGVADPDRVEYVPLAQRHVDTGMGFERVTAIIQGTKNLTDFSGTISDYETDIFRPIFDELEKLSGKKYASTLPGSSDRGAHAPSRAAVGASPTAFGKAPDATPEAGVLPRTEQEKIDIAFRVIADHIRTLSFAIADGIIPSNEGRGYVLRRVLRRAVRYGRTLGFHEPFFFKLVDVVARTMGNVFLEVRAKQQTIRETIWREEEAFNKTLDRGIEIFYNAVISAIKDYSTNVGLGDKMILHLHPHHTYIAGRERPVEVEFTNVYSPERELPNVDIDVRTIGPERLFQILGGNPILRGKDVFDLYDTYGFPLDLTELMARERGLSVDVAGFEKLMEEQRERARKAQKKSTITVQHVVDFPTQFVGYDLLETYSKLFKIVEKAGGIGSGDKWAIVDVSPFYAESGGQVGDTGELRFLEDSKVVQVVNTLNESNTFYLKLANVEGFDWASEAPLHLKVDAARRHAIERHHTVTHLLHWVLHKVVSRDAVQKGSYVGPDKLTFDFSSAALTPQQKRDVEKLVNEKIAENAPVAWTEIPYAEAKKRKNIQQFFGEKYGDVVRVVQIGGDPKTLDGYSMELCGGTHVRSTSEIGPFRIVREEAIAAGIRRIEAVAGDAARDWAQQEAAKQQEKFDALARKKSDIAALPAFSNEGETAEMLKQIDARAAHLEKVDVDVREWEKKNAKASDAQIRNSAAEIAKELAASCAGKDFCVTEVANADGKLLGAVAEALKPKFKGPIFLAGVINGRVALIASVPKELTSKFQANKIIQEIAPIVDGKGGGRPENAQGAGTDASKINQALDRAKRVFMG